MKDSHSFTVKYDGRANVLISDVQVSYPFPPNNPPSQQKIAGFKAIWDTGASGTAITSNVVASLNLKPIRKATVNHADGQSEQDVYLVSLFLPNYVVVPSVSVTEAKLSNGIDLLIGMDIIGMGDFAVTNHNNKTTFSLRIPSFREIDFVKEHNDFSKTGRNGLCPCGSGKKYKNCHSK